VVDGFLWLAADSKRRQNSRPEMTLEEVFESKESNFKFLLLGAFYSGIARQQKWVIDFANWGVGAAGIYCATVIANLDKLRPLLKPNWFCWVIVFLSLSAFIGVAIRFILAWNDSVLQFQVEMEAKAKEEWFKNLDNQKHDWGTIRDLGHKVFRLTIESAKIVASKQPWPFCCFSKSTLKKLENQMEIGLKRAFQIYWLSLWALLLQIFSLALAILWPLMRLKAHVH
jgi:hypothetical protein